MRSLCGLHRYLTTGRAELLSRNYGTHGETGAATPEKLHDDRWKHSYPCQEVCWVQFKVLFLRGQPRRSVMRLRHQKLTGGEIASGIYYRPDVGTFVSFRLSVRKIDG